MKQILNGIIPLFALLLICCLAACSGGERTSRVERYQAQMHEQDSVSLAEQQRTLDYYQAQREAMMPVIDSLIPLFKYEAKDPKYQDHGYYVLSRNGVRILVRDDAQDLLMYRNGKRVNLDQYRLKEKDPEYPLFERALHLQIVMSDILELEKRIRQTSLEVQKYEKRLQKQ